ncbi:DUF4865 family protein [[Clostridium] innocuum]|nr:DUF4865 family protein [[Clostridium] innocuum]
MIAMQYRIMLPNSYDMQLIRKRVADNGHKTDGFPNLICKAYLMKESSNSYSGKEYSPLYIWNRSEGMNKFLFDGFYDNILKSFGWQSIQTGIVLHCELTSAFTSFCYVSLIEYTLSPKQHMNRIPFSMETDEQTGKILIYNPTQWTISEYYFYKKYPKETKNAIVYEILHLSV